MFAVLQIKKGDTGIKSRIKNFFSPPSVEFRKVHLNNIPVFFTVEATLHKGEIPWRFIENNCRNLCERLILPQGIIPPSKSKIKPYTSQSFETVLLFNTMLHYIRLIKADPAHSYLCLEDTNAVLPSLLLRAVPFFSQINIITKNKTGYSAVCNKILDNYGLSVTLTSEPCYTDENTVMVCTNAETVPLLFKGTVFCNRNIPSPDCFVIKGTSPELSDAIKAIMPDDIDPFLFAAALYELSDVCELSDTRYIL